MAPMILWKLPVASTALTRSPVVTVLPRRQYQITFHLESESGGEFETSLFFDQVIGYKCTYLPALTLPMIENAYGQLVDLGKTEWLLESQRLADKWSKGRDPITYRHLQLLVDDGPCWEFLCEGYRFQGLEGWKPPA